MGLVKFTTEEVFEYHRNNFGGGGKFEIMSKVPVRAAKDPTLAYTPGVADVCRAIERDPALVHEYTAKDNTIVVLSDGTAVLGLGDIGPEAGMPVMEGKSVLFKMLAGVDAFPLCIGTKDPDKIIEFAKNLEPSVGGINLEDISAPRCFEIEDELKRRLDIFVFHDDQHGTAVVTLAGLINSLKIVGKKLADVKIVMNGAGAASIATAKLLMTAGAQNIVLCDINGTIFKGRRKGMNRVLVEMARITNLEMIKGGTADAMKGADVFLGLSAPKTVNRKMVKSMAKDPIVFAMANPVPEIMPDEAEAAGAAVVATGRSDIRNQVNNSMAFPGIFRGALDVRARNINDEMKIAAAEAIAGYIDDDKLEPNYIIPGTMDYRVPPLVAAAVARSAMETGEARIQVSPDEVAEKTLEYLYEGTLRFLENSD